MITDTAAVTAHETFAAAVHNKEEPYRKTGLLAEKSCCVRRVPALDSEHLDWADRSGGLPS